MALWTQQVWRGGLAVTTRCSAHCAFSLGLLSPQPCWAPGGPSLLAAAPADLRAGCLVQGNLGPGCLYLPHNACFHSGQPALVHGGASCPPLPLENQRIQLEEFSGVLPHPRPHRVTAQAHWGDTAREPRTPWELSGPIDLGAPPPVRASGQASQGAAHRGQLSWSPQITGAAPVKTGEGDRRAGAAVSRGVEQPRVTSTPRHGVSAAAMVCLRASLPSPDPRPRFCPES